MVSTTRKTTLHPDRKSFGAGTLFLTTKVTITMPKMPESLIIRRRQQRPSPWKDLSAAVFSLLFVAFSGFKTADASYAISIAPGSEECYTFLTPSNVGTTATIS
jgi:hypothetical protein